MCVSWRKAGGGVFARDLCVSHIVYVEYGVFAEIPGNDLESVQCVEGDFFILWLKTFFDAKRV